MVEVTHEGHRDIDHVRTSVGLPMLEKYWHNNYLEETDLYTEMRKNDFELKDKNNFSFYQFMSKVMYPLIVLGEDLDFKSDMNKAASLMAKIIQSTENIVDTYNFYTKLLPNTAYFAPGKERMKEIFEYVWLSLGNSPMAIDRCSHQRFFHWQKKK